jgi:hypothetical protein
LLGGVEKRRPGLGGLCGVDLADGWFTGLVDRVGSADPSPRPRSQRLTAVFLGGGGVVGTVRRRSLVRSVGLGRWVAVGAVRGEVCAADVTWLGQRGCLHRVGSGGDTPELRKTGRLGTPHTQLSPTRRRQLTSTVSKLRNRVHRPGKAAIRAGRSALLLRFGPPSGGFCRVVVSAKSA